MHTPDKIDDFMTIDKRTIGKIYFVIFSTHKLVLSYGLKLRFVFILTQFFSNLKEKSLPKGKLYKIYRFIILLI